MDSTLRVYVEIVFKIQWNFQQMVLNIHLEKSESWGLFHTINKNEFKMDLTPKCDT